MDRKEEERVRNRINELYHKKQTKGSTSEEQAEREELHKKFIANFRAGFRQQIGNLALIDKNGKEITSKEAKRAQHRKGLRKD